MADMDEAYLPDNDINMSNRNRLNRKKGNKKKEIDPNEEKMLEIRCYMGSPPKLIHTIGEHKVISATVCRSTIILLN